MKRHNALYAHPRHIPDWVKNDNNISNFSSFYHHHHQKQYTQNLNGWSKIHQQQQQQGQGFNCYQTMESPGSFKIKEQNRNEIPIGIFNHDRFLIEFKYLPSEAFKFFENIRSSYCNDFKKIWHFSNRHYHAVVSALNSLNPPIRLGKLLPEPTHVIPKPPNLPKELSTSPLQIQTNVQSSVSSISSNEIKIIQPSTLLAHRSLKSPSIASTVLLRTSSPVPCSSRSTSSSPKESQPNHSTSKQEISQDSRQKYIFCHKVKTLESTNTSQMFINLNLIPTEIDERLKQIPDSHHDRKEGKYYFSISANAQVNEALSFLNPKLLLADLPSSKQSKTDVKIKEEYDAVGKIEKADFDLECTVIRMVQKDFWSPRIPESTFGIDIEDLSQSIELQHIPGFHVVYDLFQPTQISKKDDILFSQEIKFIISERFTTKLDTPSENYIVALRLKAIYNSNSEIVQAKDVKDTVSILSIKLNNISLGQKIIQSSHIFDITEFLNKDQTTNLCFVHGAYDISSKTDIILSISIVRRLTVQEMILELKSNSYIPISQTNNPVRRRKIKEFRMPLICKLNYEPIKLPCRGISCKHPDCFDAESFLKYYQYAINLICPICSIPLVYEDLEIDKYFEYIIKSLGNISSKSILVNSDGTFDLSSVEINLLEDKSFDSQDKLSVINKKYDNETFEIDCKEPLDFPGYKVIAYLIQRISIYRKTTKGRIFYEKIELFIPKFYELGFDSSSHWFKIKLRIAIRMGPNHSPASDMPPMHIQLFINDVFVEIKSEGKTDFTVDITDFLVPLNNVGIIKASVQKPSDHRVIICTGAIVVKIDSKQMLEELKTMPYYNPTVIDNLKNGINKGSFTEDSETSVSLLCPYGKNLIKIPCKGTFCKHLECFDFLEFLKSYESSWNWLCPFCYIPLEFEDLRVDGFFQAVLNSIGETFIEQINVDLKGRCFISLPAPPKIPAILPATTPDDSDEESIISACFSMSDSENLIETVTSEDDSSSISSVKISRGCCVCPILKGDDENPMISCNQPGCDVTVHWGCYGIQEIPPSGKWLCQKCKSWKDLVKLQCELCPSYDGAFKKTDGEQNDWAHVVCALYIPGISFKNVDTMEPIHTSRIQHKFHASICCICVHKNKQKIGVCIQCSKYGCKKTFHVTCAQTKGLLCEESCDSNPISGKINYCGYCSYHFKKFKPAKKRNFLPPFKKL